MSRQHPAKSNARDRNVWRPFMRRGTAQPKAPADDVAITVEGVDELYPAPELIDAAQFVESDAHIVEFQPDGPSVALTRAALGAAVAHAAANSKIEVAGVCLGQVFSSQERARLLIQVDEMIPAEHTESGPASVTFTTETWIDLFDRCEAQFPHLRLLGWYHTHPGFGVFLSGMDRFIHDNFFVLDWQLAIVLDPVQRHVGIFGRDAQGRILPVILQWDDDLRLTQAPPYPIKHRQRRTR